MLNREVTEEDTDSGSAGSAAGEALLLVEEMLMQERSFQTTVVRFCGLVGYDRSPANYLGRMAEISDPGQPMNLIHRDDCINIITEIIRLGQWGEVFNACSPGHPSRIDYYSKAAEIGGIELLLSMKGVSRLLSRSSAAVNSKGLSITGLFTPIRYSLFRE